MPNTANEQIADELLVHSINLQRVAASLCQPVSAALNQLEASLLAEIAAGAARPSPEGGRFNALLRQARANVRAAYKTACKTTEAALFKVAAAEQQKTVQVINKALGSAAMNITLDEEQLQKIARDTLLAGRFSWQWFLAQETALAGKFEAAMREGVTRHEGVGALTQRVRGTKQTPGLLAVPKRQAEVTIRGLVQAVAHQARLLTCEKNAGPNGVVRAVALHATLDSQTTHGCQALHGKSWALPSYEPIDHEEPLPAPCPHFGCRSSYVAVVEGPPARPETAKAFLDRMPAAKLDALIGPRRAHYWRAGKLTVSEALDQRDRPLPVSVLTSMVDNGHSVPVPRFREGDGGLSLAERRLLNQSHAAATQDGKVLSHFMDAATGQSVAFEGTSPTPEAREAAAGFGKLIYLRGSLTNGAMFTPSEYILMSSLPNFSVARLVSPDGSVASLAVQKGQTFTRADALLLNERLDILKNTAALNPLAKIHAALGLSSRVKMGAKITSVLVLDRPPSTIRPAPRRRAVAA